MPTGRQAAAGVARAWDTDEHVVAVVPPGLVVRTTVLHLAEDRSLGGRWRPCGRATTLDAEETSATAVPDHLATG